MENVILTNMCMVSRGDEVLVQRRPDSYRWSGIAFPGGHVEFSEPFVKSVIREVYEESGLIIKNPHLCGIKQWQTVRDGTEARYIVLLYKADEFEGDLHSSDEGEVFWVKKSELRSLDLANTFEHILTVYENEDLEELFSYQKDGIWQFDFF